MGQDNSLIQIEERRELVENIIREKHGVQIGDLYYGSWEGFGRVIGFEMRGEDFNEEYPLRGVYAIIELTEDGITWEDKTKTLSQEYLNSRGNKFVALEFGETHADAIKELKADMDRAILDPSFLAEGTDGGEDETGNALMALDSKSIFEDAAALITQRQKRAEMITEMVKKRLSAIQAAASALQKKLKRVMRVVHVLEVYLGISEDITQIQDGAPAPIDTPISIRQRVLFMDEEAAVARIFENGRKIDLNIHIDWASVEEFDNWLLEADHLDRVLPEKKGVVALKPSRQERQEYGTTMWERQYHKDNNEMTYILIRNGDQVYRIWTGLTLGSELFPTQTEDRKIAEMFEKSNSRDREDAESKQLRYIRNALLIQGLVDRTQVLAPLPAAISLTQPETFESGLVIMIRDAEMQLGDGMPSFSEWQKEINSQLVRGSRIYLGSHIRLDTSDDFWRHQFLRDLRYPLATPNIGIYTVEDFYEFGGTWPRKTEDVEAKLLRILYMPSDETYNRRDGYNDRTRRESFLLWRNDNVVLNYDLIDIDMLFYYLESRQERINILTILRAVAGLIEVRTEELAAEKQFVELMSQALGCDEEKVWAKVEWWKTEGHGGRLIFKRPLDQDDKKAWRMIKSAVNRG